MVSARVALQRSMHFSSGRGRTARRRRRRQGASGIRSSRGRAGTRRGASRADGVLRRIRQRSARRRRWLRRLHRQAHLLARQQRTVSPTPSRPGTCSSPLRAVGWRRRGATAGAAFRRLDGASAIPLSSIEQSGEAGRNNGGGPASRAPTDCLRQLGGTAAGRVPRHSGDAGKLGRREGAAVDQSGQDIRPRRIAGARFGQGRLGGSGPQSTLVARRNPAASLRSSP